MEDIKTSLIAMIYDPYNPMTNFNLAAKYHDIGQTAIALSYYLRCAEFTNDDILACEALLRASLCVSTQNGRDAKEIHLIRHAISVLPHCPQANLLQSHYYSYRGQWLKAYTIVCNALQHIKSHSIVKSFILDTPWYNGKVSLLFQKAFTGTEIGKIQQSKDIYIDLLCNYELNEEYIALIKKNLSVLPEPYSEPIIYDDRKLLKHKFDNYELIERNYSQVYQDMFVLSMLNGKKNGVYLEIGAGNYSFGNNTYLLEKVFNWKGISIDINKDLVDDFNENRDNECICKNALDINYTELLNHFSPTTIDYLQLDCDPPNITYDILLKIPFDIYKFGVITYEHDYYNDFTRSYRDKSREYLKSYGYILIAGNICPDNNSPFEDWWIHPSIIDSNIYMKYYRNNDKPINGEAYMLS